MRRQIFRYQMFILAVMGFVACSSNQNPVEAPSVTSRYSIEQDRAPSRPMDLTSVAEVVPEPVRRTLAGNRSPYEVLGETYYVLPTEEGYSQRGVASWYGEKFHGHKTSNGEVFSMYEVSAAHKSLPIPSFLKVTNLDNNRSIVVRVNDRGPFHGDRIIDLSYAAALKLGYAHLGTTRVQLDAITVNEPIAHQDNAINKEVLGILSSSEIFLQVGAFSDIKSAESVSNKLRKMTTRPVFIRSITNSNNDVLHRVRIGPVHDSNEIQQITQRLVAAKLGQPYPVTD